MSFHYVAAVLTFAAISVSGPLAHAADQEQPRIVDLTAVVLTPPATPALVQQARRPAILPLLYATLGATQAWDVYSTQTALEAGAREANPATAAFGTSTGALIGLKAATMAGTIVFAERMWKKNRVAAIVMLVAVNGATAAVAMHNMRNANAARQAGR